VFGLICRFCGSESLVWDHGAGFVVCASCGSVIGELVDDGVPFSRFTLKPRRSRFSARFSGLKFEGGGSFDRLSLLNTHVNSRALSVLSSYPLVRLALELVDSSPLLKARTLRGRVAIALYLVHRSLGFSKSRSRILASRALRVSPRTIERVERKSRGALRALEVKARDVIVGAIKEGGLAKLEPLIS
jgi:transcription initiation factor TFIIIB Brf1 subunit/transcription initiation factor TFIIB